MISVHDDGTAETVGRLVGFAGDDRRRFLKVQFGEDAARVDRVGIVRLQVEDHILGADRFGVAGVLTVDVVERVQEVLDAVVRVNYRRFGFGLRFEGRCRGLSGNVTVAVGRLEAVPVAVGALLLRRGAVLGHDVDSFLVVGQRGDEVVDGDVLVGGHRAAGVVVRVEQRAQRFGRLAEHARVQVARAVLQKAHLLGTCNATHQL